MLAEVPDIDYGAIGAAPPDVFYCDQEYSYFPTEAWGDYLKPLIAENGVRDSDLVIEGGIGLGATMPDIAKGIFPDALYIGTDISEAYVNRFGRTGKSITNQTLNKVTEANQGEFNLKEARIAGNCLDADLINDILVKSGKSKPVLVSMNAMAALFGNKSTPDERKRNEDIFGYEEFLGSTPYRAQLHLLGLDFVDFWNGNEYSSTRICTPFFRLEEAARALGWKTQQLPIGLFIAKPNI